MAGGDSGTTMMTVGGETRQSIVVGTRMVDAGTVDVVAGGRIPERWVTLDGTEPPKGGRSS